jgi:hypothetical protein
MPLTPSPLNDGQPTETPAEPVAAPRRWSGKLLNVCFAIFAFEIGIFLVIFPWMDDTWKMNYFPTVNPALRSIWEDPYFRGALTGLGLVNIYVALWEFFRSLRRNQ